MTQGGPNVRDAPAKSCFLLVHRQLRSDYRAINLLICLAHIHLLNQPAPPWVHIPLAKQILAELRNDGQ